MTKKSNVEFRYAQIPSDIESIKNYGLTIWFAVTTPLLTGLSPFGLFFFLRTKFTIQGTHIVLAIVGLTVVKSTFMLLSGIVQMLG